MELTCSVQNYAWGKKGSKSAVAELAYSSCPCDKVDENIPYAELWMGTHPSGPSVITSTGEKLSDWIEKNPQSLGEKVIKVFGKQLPYLFKVLSVNETLSIQAHPEKGHAEILNREFPDIYKDPNHKPEMALALTPFQALCGFRPLQEIKTFLKDIPEFASVVGESNVSQFVNSDEANSKTSLQTCFKAFLTASKDLVKDQLLHLKQRITKMNESSRPVILGDLFLRLNSQYPSDAGCFGIYFFNYILLQPGEAMFLGPNEPHAYLYGDCVECMACSDNVVRAGLSPKYIDIPTLCEMLTYKSGTAEENKFEGKKEDEFTTLFKPPVPDFAVVKIELPSTMKSYNVIPRDSATILIVIKGDGTVGNNIKLHKGSVLFLTAKEKITIQKSNNEMLIFQAAAIID